MEHERIPDDISKGFADLTALLEDAAGLAVEGQSRLCTVEDFESLAAFILPEMNEIIRVLTALERLITIWTCHGLVPVSLEWSCHGLVPLQVLV